MMKDMVNLADKMILNKLNLDKLQLVGDALERYFLGFGNQCKLDIEQSPTFLSS